MVVVKQTSVAGITNSSSQKYHGLL